MATVRQRFSAFFLRSPTGGLTPAGSSEVSDFEAKYARLLRARDTLRKVETTTKLYVKKARSLTKAAKAVGLAVGTPDAEVKKVGEDLAAALDDDALVKAISAKVLLLDDTVRQRKKLDELKGVKDHHTQRLQQIRSKRAANPSGPDDVKLHVEEAKWQAKLEHSQKEYDELLQELTEALDFIDAQTRNDGPWSLVGFELEGFRANQIKLSKGLETLFTGAPAGTYRRDPAAEKAAVEAERAMETAALVTGDDQTAPPSTNASEANGGASSPEKKDNAAPSSASRPKPPKPPGAGGSDDDDDDDDE